MNDVINKIIEIEKKAQDVIDATQDTLKEMDCETNSQIDEIKTNIFKRAENKVQQIRDLESDEIQRTIEFDREKFEDKKKKLNQIFQSNFEIWQQETIDKIVT